MNKELVLRNAKLIYSDFRGINSYLHGGPSIGVKIDGRKADKFAKEGWNVKMAYINNKKVWFIPVAAYVPYNSSKPKFEQRIAIHIPGYQSRHVANYDDRFKMLDYFTVISCNLTIIGYHWNTNYPYKREGIKPYLKDGWIEISRYIDCAKKVLSVDKEIT